MAAQGENIMILDFFKCELDDIYSYHDKKACYLDEPKKQQHWF